MSVKASTSTPSGIGKIVIAHFSDLFGHTFKAHALTADNISVEKHKHKADGYESHEKHRA